MEDNNTLINLSIKQMLQSDAMAYNKEYMAKPIDVNFGLFDKAYQDTGRTYAKLKLAIQVGNINTNTTNKYNAIDCLVFLLFKTII